MVKIKDYKKNAKNIQKIIKHTMTNDKVFSRATINPNILATNFSVRGPIVVRADEINRQLRAGNVQKHPFEDILFCNHGNPQELGQKPISFYRNVLALCTQPELMNFEPLRKIMNKDVMERAKAILSSIDGGQTGAYTHTQGVYAIRQKVTEFIVKRDGLPVDTVAPERIFLSDGASPAIQNCLKLLIRDTNSGIMTPIPQYPLYSGTIQTLGGKLVGYYLDEENGWSLSVDELERSYQEAVNKGIDVRALVIINPGNPTGQVLPLESLQAVVEFCEKRRVLLLADEVYQENIYGERPFISFSKVVHDMGKTATFEMVSFHSCSKGYLGECGRRGGYLHLSPAIDQGVIDELYKICSILLCSNVDGQVMVDLMVDPPKEGDESYNQFNQEREFIMSSLKRRAQKLVKVFNELEGVTCQASEGAMYAYPKITIPAKAVQEAQMRKMAPDAFFCTQLLENTGVCVVPGSGFGQKDGTFHFRTTFLLPEQKIDSVIDRIRKFHEDFLIRYGQENGGLAF
jgi:alanine transaminase